MRTSGSLARSVFALVATALFGPSCLYDPDARCGPNQRFVSHDRCVCVEGTFLIDNRCVDCGPNSTLVDGACGCLPGYEWSDVSDQCEISGSNLGEACSGEAQCSAPYPVCQLDAGGDGYCTEGCASASDCEQGYECRLRAERPFCERPPDGQGTPCTEAADCAGFEASYCETLISHTCLVTDCTADEECSGARVCCDFTDVGYPITLCVPTNACVTR